MERKHHLMSCVQSNPVPADTVTPVELQPIARRSEPFTGGLVLSLATEQTGVVTTVGWESISNQLASKAKISAGRLLILPHERSHFPLSTWMFSCVIARNV